MKKNNILKCMAIAVSAAILFIACEKDNFIDDNYAIVSLSAEGFPTEKLIFTVNDNNLVLTAEDIKINAKDFSVIKGDLTKKGTIYELLIIPGGTDKIRVGLDPYRGFTGWNAKTVNVYADWYFNGTENLTITGYSSSVVDPSKIPAKIAGKPVTAIGYSAFYNKGLTSVSFSSGIQLEDIGESAFAYNQLSKINIPSSVVSIGRTSFAFNQLLEVDIPDSVTFVGYGAFAYNQLKSVTIKDKVTSIKSSAFAYNQIETITIPGNVEYIEDDAFYKNKLKTINILYGVFSIGNGAFGNNQLAYIDIPGSVTSLSGFNDNELTTITIPGTVTYIGNYAFYNNKLKEIDIPNTVLTIESYAFSHNELKSVIFSQNITEIKSHTFSNNELPEITIPNSVTTIRNNAFENNKLAAVNIHDRVTSIGNYAFMDNPLTKITIGKNVTLGSSAFGNGFEKAYYENDRQKGTYTLTGGKWNYAP